ncbi:MAG: TetR/AcrR family transcriptional regulator [Propionicimonas sp.]
MIARTIKSVSLYGVEMVEVVAVRRQPRGRQRMARILDAATVVFTRDGVDRATTNAIAAEAGISPGSLYQYFDNKADIARALGLRYAEQVSTAHREALAGFDEEGALLPEVLDRVLDPIVAFKNGNPAFLLLFARPDLPTEILGPLSEVDAGFTERIGQIVQLRNPDAPAADVHLTAGTVVNLFRCVVGTLGTVSGDPAVDLAEVKRAMLGYFRERNLS